MVFSLHGSLVSRAARHYDHLSAAYELIADGAEHKVRDRGLALLDPRPGERVLEVGAGTGRTLERLAEAVGGSGLVCALDISERMLRLARTRAEATSIHLLRGDGRVLPFESASFDAVFMSFTLELFEPADERLLLREAARVLAPAGRLGVVALNAEHTLPVSAYEWLHRRFPEWIDCRPIPVRDVLRDAGFVPVVGEHRELWGLPVMIMIARPSR
jgi:demethylmenaquinone methyltransferase/2-methoxy-6-polyprenyl-1,4-benzoquinol methylase